MSNFDNKTTRSVADIVANIMSEKLHPNQQKLDVVDDEKIDGKDFAKLRSMKKEEAEQLKEYESKGGSYTHKGTYGYAGKGAEHGDTDYAKENELAKAADKPKKPARGKYGARQNFKRSTRVNEGFSSMIDALQEKGLKGLAEAMSHQAKVTMKHVDASDASDKEKAAIKQASKDIKPGVSGYQDRAAALTAAGIKKEEVDNDTFTKEVADQKAKFDGKKKGADVAKASVQAVQQEQTHTTIEVVDLNGVNGVQMSNIELDERELTAAETAKKEDTVKSMKKNLQGFKDRYGDKAKSVMYATATKQAKGE
jgi:hypothetical protein